MSYKVGFLLSMIFVVMFFLFAVDMINLQFIYTDLDQSAISIGYLIAKQGNMTIIPELEKRFDCQITYKGDEFPRFGDVVEFYVQDHFQPMIISKKPMQVSICRTTVIGYYD